MQLKTLSCIALALLALAGCGGGGGGDSSQDVVVPATPPHDAATTNVSSTNVPFLLANAQAVQHLLRWWAGQVLQNTTYVSPANPTGGYLCGDGPVDVLYKDLDNNKRESVNDQIVVSSPACSITPLGGGTTTITALAADASDVTDARVTAEGTVENWALGIYGWSHRLTGTFRFTTIDAERIFIRNEGPVQLALPGGQVLEVRNLAITYWPYGGTSREATSGQFDLLFQSGREAGTLIQVDTLGQLLTGGANEGPSPGLLQISGLNGSKARLQGKFVNGVGARFLTSLDATGAGQFVDLSDVSDTEFYANFRQ